MDRIELIGLSIGGVLIFLVGTAIIIGLIIKRDEKKSNDNKYVILFNRRTREIKEILNKEYKESKTWEKIATTYNSRMDDFMLFLKRDYTVNDECKYTGRASEGAFLLRWKFKRMLHAEE